MLAKDEILQHRYRIVSQLGHGGMGAVYEARDERLGSSVALKEILLDLDRSEHQEAVRRAFEREAKILANLAHEAFPRVTDYFSEKDRQFLVMELIYGDDLGELLEKRKNPFPPEEILKWTAQLLDALDYLHAQTPPIIHRDIKPQNLKLTARGRLKLLDFGIAKGADGVSANTVTNHTFIAATLNYSPIEQMFRVLHPSVCAMLIEKHPAKTDRLMNQAAGARSDIYALGATLYNLATGVVPVDSLKRAVAVWAGEPDPLPNPRLINPQIPQFLAGALLKAMAVDYEDRFASAAEMQTALQPVTSAPTLVLPATSFPTIPDARERQAEKRTEVLPFNPPPTTAQPSVATVFARPKPPAKTGNSMILWAVLALGVLLISVGGIGAYVAIKMIPGEPEATPIGISTSPTPAAPPPSVTPSLTPTAKPTAGISPVPEKTATPERPEPTPKPTQNRQQTEPRPTATRKPQPKPTRKNMDCIFNDDCG